MKLPSWLANRGLSKVPFVERIADRFYKKSEITTIYGHRMILDPQDSMNLSRWGFYEREESNRLLQLVQPANIVVDVGANIGYYSLLLASIVGSKGFVYAFEPHPENYAILLLNIAQNNYEGRIVANNAACSSIAGWMYLHLSPISSGMHTLQESMLERDTYRTTSQLEVRTVLLDESLLNLQIDFMKIDVEGHELEVLKGAEQLLILSRPVLMVEYHASPKVIPFLESYDYEIDCLNEKNLFAYPTKPGDKLPRSIESLAES